MTLTEWLIANDTRKETFTIRRCECKDGYSISIQASGGHYCWPRDNLPMDEYIEFELGYPEEFDRLIDSYAEDPGTISTVFAYVPKEIVEELIVKHGGIA